MSVHVAAGAHHTYRANAHDTVLSEVCAVHCVLLPRALLVAGFSEDGGVVMARCSSYAATDPAWATSFFEREFMTEKLLGVPTQVKAIFIGSREELIIPDALYEAKAARSWMTRLQGICPDDVLHACPLPDVEAQYVFALPAPMDKLLHRYFGHTPVLPVAAYQFYKPAEVAYLLQCFIAQDTVTATLHAGGKLLWHQQFGYETVEDIAWKAAHLCRQLHIPRIDLRVQCTMLCDTGYDLAPELECFFPKITWTLRNTAGEGPWAPVIYLLQQLYACAL